MIRKVAALLVTLAVIVCALMPAQKARSAPYRIVKITLWNGATFDSTAHVKWFNCQHASHIVLRSWTTHAAYVANTDVEADSAFSDSIATFGVLFSDSLSFMARDSLGTVVTSSSLIPTTTSHGDPYPIGADSVALAPTTAAQFVADTVNVMAGVHHAPINVALRSASNGSGFFTGIYPTAPVSIAIYGDGEIHKRLVGIKVTPLRRSTAATVSATVPSRVNGLKGFRMEAWVYYQTEQ